jgi:hypothetical protein
MTVLSCNNKPHLSCGKLIKENDKFKYYLDIESNNWIKSTTIKPLKNYIAYIVYKKEDRSMVHLLVHNLEGKSIPVHEASNGCDFYDKITQLKTIAKYL